MKNQAAIFLMLTACSVETAAPESTQSTTEEIKTAPKPEATLMCGDCFEETNGGGPGTPNGLGSNGFVGGVAGYANGATGVAIKSGEEPCDPGIDCVHVKGTPRGPLDESTVRIRIVGFQPRETIDVDLPRKRGIPSRVEPSTPKGFHHDCAVPGATCMEECAALGAPCIGASLYHGANDGSGYGLLTSCRNGPPTYTCSYRFSNGELCAQPFMAGQRVGFNICTTKDGKTTSAGW